MTNSIHEAIEAGWTVEDFMLHAIRRQPAGAHVTDVIFMPVQGSEDEELWMAAQLDDGQSVVRARVSVDALGDDNILKMVAMFMVSAIEDVLEMMAKGTPVFVEVTGTIL